MSQKGTRDHEYLVLDDRTTLRLVGHEHMFVTENDVSRYYLDEQSGDSKRWA
jgi:hypothetical protein